MLAHAIYVSDMQMKITNGGNNAIEKSYVISMFY